MTMNPPSIVDLRTALIMLMPFSSLNHTYSSCVRETQIKCPQLHIILNKIKEIV